MSGKIGHCYYGPYYSFWLFSFERYNGILDRYHTNHRSIEIQLIQKFMENMHMKSLVNDIETIPSESHFLFNGLLGSNSGSTANNTLFCKSLSSFKIGTLLSCSDSDVVPTLDFVDNIPFKLLSPFTMHKFNLEDTEHLTTSYKTFLPDVNENLPQLCRNYRCAVWISERLNCSKFSIKNFICVQAYWPERNGKITTNCKTLWTGKLEYFFSQRIYISGLSKEVVLWLKSSGLRNIKRKKFDTPYRSVVQ